jgi:glutamate-1-semialdehyde 2,1-aminomutase
MMRKTEQSEKLFQEANKYLPGGVNSPVRAYKAVGGIPPFIVRGKGSHIYDTDKNVYIDYVGSWGPLILGHAYGPVVEAVKKTAEQGMTYGAPTELEVVLAKMVSEAIPSMEILRFVNSGTEATMSALRVARAFTKRDLIIKFDGGYHGHSDGLLTKAGSGLATFGIPDSPGVPDGYSKTTLVAPYNDIEAVKMLSQANPGQIAVVIIEPVAANMGLVLPKPGYLAALRELTQREGTPFIFDEVISGFRVGYGGAQGLFGIKPDLTCLGKIVGGGLPVGAYGGRRDIMSLLAPVGPVYQAGTLSGNPVVMAAGIETLKALGKPGVYEKLEASGTKLQQGIIRAAEKADVNISVPRVGSLMTAFFTEGPVTDYASARKSDTALFARVFHRLLDQGIYWPPSQFEAAFVSLAHSAEDIEATVKAFQGAFRQ